MADDPKPEPKAGDPITAEDLNKTIDALVKKHAGDPNAALRAVLGDRDTLRDELAATKGKLPKDGSVVLDADGAKLWGAYQALGDPAALAKQLEAGTAATAERDDLKFRAHVGEVGGLMKWKPSVLADRVKASGVEILVKDEPDPKDPKAKVKVPHVKLEGDKTTPLADYAKEHWGDYLPALQAEPARVEAPRGSPPSNGHAPARPAVVPKPDQPRRSFVS